MLDILFGRKTPGKVGKITLDAMLSEGQHFANEVTRFPIESGSSISDHVIQEPEEVTIEGFVTNAPVPYGETAKETVYSYINNTTGNLSNTIEDRVLNNYLELLRIAGYKAPNKAYEFNELKEQEDTGTGQLQLVEIVTGLRVYTDMALVDLNIPREPKTGDSLKFTARFRKMKTVDTAEIPRIPATIKKDTTATTNADKSVPGTVETGKGELKSEAFIQLLE